MRKMLYFKAIQCIANELSAVTTHSKSNLRFCFSLYFDTLCYVYWRIEKTDSQRCVKAHKTGTRIMLPYWI